MVVVVVVDTVEPLLLQNEPNFVLHFNNSTLQISTDNYVHTNQNNTVIVDEGINENKVQKV